MNILRTRLSANNTPEHLSTSALMSQTLEGLEQPFISVGDLFEAFSQRSFGGVILLLSVLGLIPGISIIAGFIILVLAFQIMAGHDIPRLPSFLQNRPIKVETFRTSMSMPLRYLARLEKLVKPRLPSLVTPTAFRISGVVVALLATVMMAPFPLSNILPAISLFLIALGLLEDDGMMVIAGLLSSVFALALGLLMIGLLYELAQHFLGGEELSG